MNLEKRDKKWKLIGYSLLILVIVYYDSSGMIKYNLNKDEYVITQVAVIKGDDMAKGDYIYFYYTTPEGKNILCNIQSNFWENVGDVIKVAIPRNYYSLQNPIRVSYMFSFLHMLLGIIVTIRIIALIIDIREIGRVVV